MFDLQEKAVLSRIAKIVRAREDFKSYCRAKDPLFYTPEKTYLFELTDILHRFYFRLPMKDGKVYRFLIINMPPRFGKTRTVTNWCEWILGRNNEERIIVGSYNDKAASKISKFVRNDIQRTKIDEAKIIFSDIFPDTRVQQGDSAREHWTLEGQHFNFLATGPGGSSTGDGGTVLVVDDALKGHEEALNENVLQDRWEWITSTLLSRTEPGFETLRLFVGTRWAKGDPPGKLIDKLGQDVYIHSIESMNRQTGAMLCPSVLSKEEYELQRKLTLPAIFFANHHQEPLDIKGGIYQSFKTYESLPTGKDGKSLVERIILYVDMADGGGDYHCAIAAAVIQGRGYVLDVLYTQDPSIKTIPRTADLIVKNKVNLAKFESNAGGRIYAQSVDASLKGKKYFGSVVKWFHQSKNKNQRILSWSAWVQENLLFPVGWEFIHSEYYRAMKTFSLEMQNLHDDAPDATTGLAEMICTNKISFLH